MRRIATADRHDGTMLQGHAIGARATRAVKNAKLVGMKSIALLMIALALLANTASASADDFQYDGMSGLAAGALVRAYAAVGLDGSIAPPVSLRDYVVTIQAQNDSFVVFFLSQRKARAIPAVVDARTGSVIWKYGDSPSPIAPNLPAGFVLPGVVAGEIIMAYRQAASDDFAPLATGAFNVWFLPFAGGSDVGFASLNGPPESYSTEPVATPTPSPSRKCLWVGVTGPDYSVIILNDRPRIVRHHVPWCKS